MKYRNITLRDFIQALRLNGYRQARGALVRTATRDYYTPKETITYACALGQAELNLNTSNLMYGLTRFTNKDGMTLTDMIVELNDGQNKSIPEIADIVEKEFADYLDESLVIRKSSLQNFYKNYQGQKV